MTQSQKEFEAWAKEEGFNIAHFGNGYDMPSTNYVWSAWQSSRAALVVELPDAELAATNNDPAELVYIADYIHDALDASGIKYNSRT